MGLAQWPGLHWDASCYAPPIISAARGEGFAAAAYPALSIRLEGTQTHHGLLASLLYGQIFGCSAWPKLLLCYGIVNAVTCLVWWWVYSRRPYSAVLNGGFPAAMMAGLAAGCLGVGLQGRPEHPAVAIAAIPFLFAGGSLFSRLFLLGVTSGLLFCCSPSAGIMAGTGVCVFLALRSDYSEKNFWKRFIATGLLGIFTFACTVLPMPISIIEWSRNLIRESSLTFDFSSHLVRFQNGGLWGTSIIVPFWNVLVIFYFSAISSLFILRRRWSPLVVFWIIALKHYHVFTDYGYACALLPLLRIFLGLSAAVPTETVTAFFPRCLRVLSLVWLGSFSLVFIQYVTESLAYTQLPDVRPKISDLFQGCELAARNGAPSPVVAFMNSTPQSYVVLGRGKANFVPLSEDALLGRWSDHEQQYFKQKNVVPLYVIAPPDLAQGRAELTINGVLYRTCAQDLSVAHGLAFFRPRPVGYAFVAYRRVE